MVSERHNMFTTKMFEGSESEFRTNDGFRVKINTHRLNEVLNGDNNLPILILVSGTSESGKSHLGQKFVTDKVGHRFKIYKTISDLMQSRDLPQIEGVEGFDSVSFASGIEDNLSLRAETCRKVASEYLGAMRETGVQIGVVETLKHLWLVQDLEGRNDLRVLSLYVDAPLESRISRQAKKRNVKPEEIAAEVKEKDAHKAETRTDEIADVADIMVWNGSSVETYNSFIDAFENSLKDHSRSFSTSATDYS